MAATKPEINWDARRLEVCLRPDVTNLNAGSCSPLPRPVLAALAAENERLAADPVEYIWREAPGRIELSRRVLADYVGCDPRHLLLFNNASYAVNTVLASLPLATGDELLVSNQEYYHYHALYARLAREKGVRTVTVELPLAGEAAPTEAEIVRRFAAAATPRTAAMLVSHVSCVTGMILPIAGLAALARERGFLSIVDGAHALGLVPPAVGAVRPHFYAANVHKWVMGAVGTALLYVDPAVRARIRPLVTMAGYQYEPGKDDERTAADGAGPTRWQHSHEYQGTRNLGPLVVVPTVLEFRASLGEAALRSRQLALAARCRKLLATAGLKVASPDGDGVATCMVSFRLPTADGRVDAGRTALHFRRTHNFEIAVPALAGGLPFLRISTAWFNDEAQLTRLAQLVSATDWEALR